MNDKNQHAQRGRADLPPQDARRSAISSSFERFERRQNELWRLTFLILFLLGLAYAWTSWGSIRSQAVRFEALPIGLVVLVALFGTPSVDRHRSGPAKESKVALLFRLRRPRHVAR